MRFCLILFSSQTDRKYHAVASGDLRNVAKTIAQIPSSYNQPVDVTINDRDLDIVARNAIMLLIALVVDNIDEAVDCMIHIWYSALIRNPISTSFNNGFVLSSKAFARRSRAKHPVAAWERPGYSGSVP